jgi:hypothetical protein
MKRATLTAYPTTTPSEPTDLTDRLLEHEESHSAPPAAKPQRGRPRANRPASEPGAAARPVAEPEPTATPAASSLATALAAAESAAEALRQAGREAPARYDVALRYRLDALAHHLQQVKEFVASLAAR